ncbi:uncharacterized protein LOC6569811 [Drosophila grimshawi]|uniref:GH14180 n=1 Tax=Drosophila grimshawi TaxID=7222 RepID=B4JXV6_DROGR|nr:uncharacterized protein LOC6569811 [Drosophila grimshawi]EDV90518.1 GH14180 [Drosophila grimshawi]
MSLNQSDPMWSAPECEMCANKVTNFVIGLCQRCSGIWTRDNSMMLMDITNDHVEAGVVRMSSPSDAYNNNMDATFQRGIQQINLGRTRKLQFFFKLREIFQKNILLH